MKVANEVVLVLIEDPPLAAMVTFVVAAFEEVVGVVGTATVAFEEVGVVVDVVLAAEGEEEVGKVLVVAAAGGMVNPWRVAHVAGSSP